MLIAPTMHSRKYSQVPWWKLFCQATKHFFMGLWYNCPSQLVSLSVLFGHSGAERSPGQKKHIIGGSYIVRIVCAVRFRNSWRKNMALGSFGILEKYGIFGVFWPFLVSFSLSRAVSACFWHCIWHLPTPDICLTHSDTILTLPDTLRHHPDTHQTPPYLACMRPLGERVISDYHDIYSTGFNL